MNPRVSIIVSCYNYAQYLDEALQSILDQTYVDWECIVVNDGSTDNTAAVAHKWVTKDARFAYVYKENGGVSSARNLGIEKAKGEFIVTLDADDKYGSTFIEKALTIVFKNKDIGIVSSWGVFFGNDKKLSVFKTKGESLFDFLFRNAAIGTSFFRKECWKSVGGYDENPKNGYEDWEFYLRVTSLGWKVEVIEEVLFYYRQHKVSRRIEMNKGEIENKKYIYNKNKELYLQHYEALIDYFLEAIQNEKIETVKVKNKIEFKIGSAILRPFRFIKSFYLIIFFNNLFYFL